MTRIVRRLETINRAELELPARIRSTCRFAVVDVADDADVAVRGEVLVVEQVEHVGPEFDSAAAGQCKGARQREVRVPDRSTACRVPSLWRRHVAGALSRA